MAKLLTREEFGNLKHRDRVWIEWLFGTETQEWTVDGSYKGPKSCIRKKIIHEDNAGCLTWDIFDYDRDKEWRYWDSEPTLDEREDTPWT